jgi:uncharacterized protein (TIGR02466 family)
MKIDTLFPTTIYRKDCPRLISESLKITARRICLNEGDYEFQSKCISTVRTNCNILEHPEFFRVRKEITKSIQEYCEYLKLDISRKFRVRESWLNCYQPGMYQEGHIHHNSLISGVLYILGSGTADFYVSSPFYNQQSILPEFKDKNHNFANYNYDTIDGRILLFLSSTQHATRPTDKEKISLSFNIDII